MGLWSVCLWPWSFLRCRGRRVDPKLQRLKQREIERQREEMEAKQMEFGRGYGGPDQVACAVKRRALLG